MQLLALLQQLFFHLRRLKEREFKLNLSTYFIAEPVRALKGISVHHMSFEINKSPRNLLKASDCWRQGNAITDRHHHYSTTSIILKPHSNLMNFEQFCEEVDTWIPAEQQPVWFTVSVAKGLRPGAEVIWVQLLNSPLQMFVHCHLYLNANIWLVIFHAFSAAEAEQLSGPKRK